MMPSRAEDTPTFGRLKWFVNSTFVGLCALQ